MDNIIIAILHLQFLHLHLQILIKYYIFNLINHVFFLKEMQWLSLPENLCYDGTISSALKQRKTLCKYFISSEGEVPWQYDYVRRGAYEENI